MTTNETFRPTVTAEDYEEPRCPLIRGGCAPLNKIPVDRILSKLDSYLDVGDAAGAERHLKYWIGEAVSASDKAGDAVLHEELAGLYRKHSRIREACDQALTAVSLIEQAGLSGSVSAATAYLNAGTVFRAADNPARSLAFFEKAEPAYSSLSSGDMRRAGLYNNTALTLASLGRFDEAEKKYLDAVEIALADNRAPDEAAITLLNMADLYEARDGAEAGAEAIAECLDKAEKLLFGKDTPESGEHAFVLEKCAPALDHHGRFAAAEEAKRIAGEIREKLKNERT